MKVFFDGASAQYHPATGLELKPGVNDVADDKGDALVTGKVCRRATSAEVAAAEKKAAAEEKKAATAAQKE